jgi:hypothetical protein
MELKFINQSVSVQLQCTAGRAGIHWWQENGPNVTHQQQHSMSEQQGQQARVEAQGTLRWLLPHGLHAKYSHVSPARSNSRFFLRPQQHDSHRASTFPNFWFKRKIDGSNAPANNST